MRKFRFDYSLKNIPMPSQDAYWRNFIENVENVIKRMRWKANFFLKGNKNSNESNRFGLPFHQNTSRYFGNETFRRRPFQPYRKHIKFRNARNEFQLMHDITKSYKTDQRTPFRRLMMN